MAIISIIIPVYNAEKYIKRCLDSVCNQTLSDIEIICVDDFSTDNSLKELKIYASKDKRIRVISFSENHGAAAARNRGIKEATGEYIGFVDSDDFIDIDFYEKLYKKAKQTGADITKSNLKYTGWNKQVEGKYYNLKDVEENKIKFNHVPTALFKKKFLTDNAITFPQDLTCAEDSVFEVLAAMNANKIEIVEDVTYYYVFRNESLNHTTAVTLDKVKEIEKSMLRIVDIFNDSDIDKETYFVGLDSRIKYLSFFIKDKNPSNEVKEYVLNAEKKIFQKLKFPNEFKQRELAKRAMLLWAKKLQTENKKFNENLKNEIDTKILSAQESGITENKRTPKFIVSLTSFPERMPYIHYCLYTLLNQSVKPDEVILWLAEEEFPEREKDVPEKVLLLKRFGLTINFTKNTGSYKKLIPALKNYPDDVIVTADDDVFYPRDWFKKLYEEYQNGSENILCHRAHKIKFDVDGRILPYKYWDKIIDDNSTSYINFFTGVGGVLYPPNSLMKDVINENLFLKLAPKADDIWFWSMAVLNNRKIKIITNPEKLIKPIEPDAGRCVPSLWDTNVVENDIQLKNILNHYPQILSILHNEKCLAGEGV